MQKHTRLEVRQAPEGTGGRRDASTASGEQSSASSPRGEGLGAAPVERCRNEIAMARDVRQHGIRQARLATAPRGEGIARCNHFARKRGAGTSSTRRKKRAWKNTSMHVSGQMGFPAGRGRTQPELARAGGHAKPAWSRAGWALRRVSCAGRGPGSGCAAARGRGPGAGCRRHSSGRGSAAGCAGRRLRLP